MPEPPAASRAAQLSAYPWSAIIATLLAAVVATALLVLYAGTRIFEARDTAEDLQTARLQQIALRAEANVAGLNQLSNVAAKLLGPLRERSEVQRDLLGILSASNAMFVSGAGVFYAPNAFDAKPLQGFYANRAMLARRTTLVFDETSHFNYPSMLWYKDAVAGHGRPRFTTPYFAHGHTFLSDVRAFYAHGSLGGVVIFDAYRAKVARNMRSSLQAGDVAYVRGFGGNRIVATASVPDGRSPQDTQSIRMRNMPWTLYLSSDFSPVTALQRTIRMWEALALLALWCLTFAIVANSIRIARYRAQTVGLQQRSDELQREIDARAAVEKELRVTAYHDTLTGLPNRAQILETLRGVIASSRAPGAFAVLFIDLDQFAVINDSLGHATGDKLLQNIALRITENLPKDAVLARLGGDEFVVYVPLPDSQNVRRIADAILDSLRTPFNIEGRRVYTGASLGVVLSDARYSSPEEMLRDADVAMYRAKEAGRGRFVVFDEDMHERALQRLLIESALRSAVQQNEFAVRYQPIIGLASGEVCAIEALCRWESPEYGRVSPAEFIPVAERTGAITAIDTFVMRQACADAWHLNQRFANLPVSVNVSATHLTQSDFIPSVSAALKETGLAAANLKFEITETAIMGQPAQAIRALTELRGLGVDVVLDDFGAGYSSLSYVQRLPISGLKIDRSFVLPMVTDPQSAAIVRAIVGLAKTLGLHVTAEGVETAHQVHMLAEMGVDYAQGFYFAAAAPLEDVEAIIRKRALRVSG